MVFLDCHIDCIFQMALHTSYDGDRDGMLSVGDFPFHFLLPEPILSGLRARLFHANSTDYFDPTA